MLRVAIIAYVSVLALGVHQASAGSSTLATTADVNSGMMPELSSLAMIAAGVLYMFRRIRRRSS